MTSEELTDARMALLLERLETWNREAKKLEAELGMPYARIREIYLAYQAHLARLEEAESRMAIPDTVVDNHRPWAYHIEKVER